MEVRLLFSIYVADKFNFSQKYQTNKPLIICMCWDLTSFIRFVGATDYEYEVFNEFTLGSMSKLYLGKIN